MAYRKSGTIYNRRIDKTGFTNYDDVYGIINDNVDKISEFYEIEPAMVLEVLLDPHSPNFPTKDFEGDKDPVYEPTWWDGAKKNFGNFFKGIGASDPMDKKLGINQKNEESSNKFGGPKMKFGRNKQY